MKMLLFRIWIYILKKVQESVEEKAFLATDPYVVYFDSFQKEMYVCPSGSHAVQLYETLSKLHKLTNKTYIKILYGKADEVFRYKLFRVLDLKFAWNCPEEEKQRLYSYMADTPLRNFEENKKK